MSSEAGQDLSCRAGKEEEGAVREVTVPIPEARLLPSAPGHVCHGLDAVAPAGVILVASALALALASGVSGVHVGLTASTAKRLKDNSLKAGPSHSCTSAQGLQLYCL